jgi:tetratricopeptide (TPR) repeat protein
LLEGVARKLRQFENASHYDVLGVDKLATTNTINAAFEQLTEMFQAHRRENPDRADLLRLIDELFNKIKLAHDTLSDPFKRRDYDRPVGATPPPFDPRLSERVAWPDDSRPRAQAVTPGAPRKPVPIPFNIPTPVAPKPVARPEPVIERNQATASKDRTLQMPARKAIPIPEIQMPVAPKNGNGAIERGGAETTRRNPPLPPRPNTGPLTRPPAVLSPEEVARLRNAPTNNVEQALHCYRQGKARLERREIDIAEHLFREAVRLDASQPDYHYQLAVILAIRAQARHEHMHHEGCHVTCKLGGTLVSNPKVRYEAERHFLRAHEMDPANPVIALKLGQLYKDARLLKKAELFLKTAIMLDGTNYVAQQELDDLYETESDDGSSGSLSQR